MYLHDFKKSESSDEDEIFDVFFYNSYNNDLNHSSVFLFVLKNIHLHQ